MKVPTPSPVNHERSHRGRNTDIQLLKGTVGTAVVNRSAVTELLTAGAPGVVNVNDGVDAGIKLVNHGVSESF